MRGIAEGIPTIFFALPAKGIAYIMKEVKACILLKVDVVVVSLIVDVIGYCCECCCCDCCFFVVVVVVWRRRSMMS